MGRLTERKIPTLFGGVSRQPDLVRRPNQVAVMDNALASVVTGGFEKRPNTQHIAALAGLDNTKDYAVHAIDRDSTEQTIVMLTAGSIKAFNAITGAAKTITVGDTKHYFLVEQDGLDVEDVVEVDGSDFEPQVKFDSTETTFDWGWQLSDATTGRFRVEGSADGIVWNTIAGGTPIGGAASGTFSTTIDAVATGDHNYIRVVITTAMATAADTLTLWATFKDLTYLFTGVTGPEDFAFVSVADHTFIANKNVTARLAEAGSGTVTDTARSTAVGTPPAGIPAPSGGGTIYKIVDDTDNFGTYYVIDDTTDNLWVETADPNAHNTFDGSTLPHELVRNADGTFTFAEAPWDPREVGDEVVTEAPKFIGKTVADVFFFRNRLGFLADENVVLSRSADAYNFWPEKAIEVLDTDPIDRAATTTDVNLLKFGTVFRKLLFVTSERAQFELSSPDDFSPSKAALDQATRYPATPLARPTTMGDVLYFGSSAPSHSLVYEYFFDDSSLNNTAADITKHTRDYIPTDITAMAADTRTGTLYVLTTGEQNSVYVYRTFFDGGQKLQSAWGRYTFGASESEAFIHGMAVLSGFLVLVIERFDGNIYLEQMPVESEAIDTTLNYIPLIDQREIITGTYDSTNDVTTFTPTWEHLDDAEIVLGPAFSDPGRRMTVLYPDEYLLTLASVVAGETIVINGLTFTAHATTTTTANREFSISGTDVADAGELTTVLNDATDGLLTVTATDNGDGTIALNVDDAADGTISAPTGTAIGSGTIAADEVDRKIAVREDFGTNQVYAGRQYNMLVELSKLYMREADNEPAIISGRLQIKDITFQYKDTGYFKVTVTPRFRGANDFEFSGNVLGDAETVIGSAPINSRGSLTARVHSDGSTAKIEVSNDTPLPSIITAASWRGFFNEISRQG
jgi:hypothetical protein